ncbi:bacteriohemerythrin [Carboxylicivirga sp. M1479]|uniref:bacteriohemerythrin n=1 Tax=Carboxylicivirga sp. M1479 TaxID=2594476 RepID=UPI001177FBFE|nr:bacteriohemerythrin [Carboxylicivirga sp. M1479]TRX61095.1 bacteriohemerythrin [Carboxylicivirga sp. M1479]
MDNQNIIGASKNKADLNQAYERFVPSKMYELLGKSSIADLQLGDQVEMGLTILFSDIRNFVSISESLRPKETFDFINSYLRQMDTVISQHGGVIDKVMGDGIMAIFPSNANDAVDCSLGMLKQLELINEQRLRANQASFQIGIGLNTGICMLGIVGGINKQEATVISDAVNLASRIESLTKTYGVQLLISENTYFNLKDVSNYSIRFIDRVLVKGKNQAQSIYEIYDGNNSRIRQLKDQTKNIFEEALAHYHYKKVEKAAELLKKCLAINPDDKPAQIYLERCRMFSNKGLHSGAKELSQQIEWSTAFDVGNEQIDTQHLELFNHSVKLLELINSGIDETVTDNIISFLDKYVVHHFDTEERYLLDNDYPFFDHHKAQHLNFIKSFGLLKSEIKSNSKSKIFLMFRVQTLLIDWIVNHTLKEDKHFCKYITDRISG